MLFPIADGTRTALPFVSPRLYAAGVVFEAILGMWLIVGIAPSWSWLTSIGFFTLLAVMSFRLGWPGQKRCGCAGSLRFSPWWAFSIDLIALDLDGTLLAPDESISARNRKAIADALAAGIRVVLVTGRGVDTPIRVSKELKLNLPVICCHGALTKDFGANKTLESIPVPLQYAKPMVEFAEREGLAIAIYLEEAFYRLQGSEIFMDDMRGPGWYEAPSLAEITADTGEAASCPSTWEAIAMGSVVQVPPPTVDPGGNVSLDMNNPSSPPASCGASVDVLGRSLLHL